MSAFFSGFLSGGSGDTGTGTGTGSSPLAGVPLSSSAAAVASAPTARPHPHLPHAGGGIVSGEYLSIDAVAFFGAIAFARGYFLILCTRRETVGSISSHTVYAPREIQVVALSPDPFGEGAADKAAALGRWLLNGNDMATVAERRYLSLFLSVDLTRDFFYSPTYDATQSLQSQQQQTSVGGGDCCGEIFRWNRFLCSEIEGRERTKPANSESDSADPKLAGGSLGSGLAVGTGGCTWTTPLAHGFFRSVSLSVFGERVRLTLIARRSRVFAGARFLKRGAADDGSVANDVESEQIVEDARGALSAYVQLRGSIPAHWTQRTALALPRPPIVAQPRDPTHAPARLHVADLLVNRYGAPLLALSLVKKREPRGAARESVAGREWARAAAAINKELPHALRIQFLAIDYTQIAKSPRHNVLAALRDVGRWAVCNTGFFCSAPKPPKQTRTLTPTTSTLPPPRGGGAAVVLTRFFRALLRCLTRMESRGTHL